MSRKINRKPTTARRAAASRDAGRKVRAAKAKTWSLVDAVLTWLPIGEQRLHQMFLATILGAVVALAWIAASFAGLPTMASQQLARVASDAGFKVNTVSVRGTRHLNELKVYERVLGERNRAMPLVDIEALRAELLQLSWVEDARVSRQLPSTLVIDIVERKAHAVLRKPDRLVLIDATGHELEPVNEARARRMLVVSGPGAGKQVEALGLLLEAAPALKPQVGEAEWVGNRRWNLTFKTGQVLALPEGTGKSSKALVDFAGMDGRNRLIGGKAVAFDMRAPDRIYMRVPNRAEELAPAKPAGETAEKLATKPAAKPAVKSASGDKD